MEYDDAAKRIADLERQLAEAKASAGRQPHAAFPPTERSWQTPNYARQQPKRNAGAVIGWIGGLIGGCVGGAAALTAAFPSSALWTSALVCGEPNRLMVNTSHSSYRAGQSSTNIGFQCVTVDGAVDANTLAISALQMVVVAVLLAAAVAMGLLVRRLLRHQPVGRPVMLAAVGLSIMATAVLAGVISQAAVAAAAGIQISPGGSLTVRGNAETKTIACNDGHLTVDGRAETVTVTGHCARLSVDGVIHHITVDSVDTIDVDGINNVITYHSGSPQITREGGHNTVERG